MGVTYHTLLRILTRFHFKCFNPFGTGRGFRPNQRIQKILCRYVSIPLEQGGVFRPAGDTKMTKQTIVSIPLEQGGVFRRNFRFDMDAVYVSFNPFGAGRSLSTGQYPADSCSGQVSIPL